MKWALPSLLVCLALYSGCADDRPVRQLTYELRPVESFDNTLWTGRVAADDPVVALVEGAPITLSMLNAQVARAGDGADPEVILERMIEFELLAREAFKAGHYTLDVVGMDQRRALASAMVKVAFDRELGLDKIPSKYVQIAYSKRRAAYDHYERFLVADVQLLCCTDENPDACFTDLFDEVEDRKLHHQACFNDIAGEAERIRDLLATSESVTAFHDNFNVQVRTDPDLSATYRFEARYHTYDFQYDVDRTYEAQFERPKYRIFHKAVMEGAKRTWLDNGEQTPVLSPVIRSPLGYHILFIYEVQPEQHYALSHPDVQNDIRTNIYDKWRAIYFMEQMETFCEAYGCRLEPKRLVPLQQLDEKRGT